jgi:hypothetical protein
VLVMSVSLHFDGVRLSEANRGVNPLFVRFVHNSYEKFVRHELERTTHGCVIPSHFGYLGAVDRDGAVEIRATDIGDALAFVRGHGTTPIIGARWTRTAAVVTSIRAMSTATMPRLAIMNASAVMA